MVKYIIEDGIDFWDEINNENIINEDNNNINEDNVCLISKEILTDNYITLPCSHKFNYVTLIKEITNFKCNKKMYYSNIKLNKFQIICPYCRDITNNLLPFIPTLINEKIKFVNYPFKYAMPLYKCNYTKNKHTCTSHNAYKNNNFIFCQKHHTLIENNNLKLIINSKLTPEMINYSKNNNVKDIKNILKLNNLKCSGIKNELIIRIFDNNLN